MNWEVRYCPNQFCRAEAFTVARQPELADAWWIALPDDGSTWDIAATAPVCPLCTAELGIMPNPVKHTWVEDTSKIAG